jgi:hypothetical protein
MTATAGQANNNPPAFRPDSHPRDLSDAHISLHIGNYDQIAAAFGSEAAEATASAMNRVLADLLHEGGSPTRRSPSEIDILVRGKDADEASADLERAIVGLAFTPILYAGKSIHLALTGSVAKALDSTAEGGHARNPGLFGLEYPAQWAERYRSDMALATEGSIPAKVRNAT